MDPLCSYNFLFNDESNAILYLMYKVAFIQPELLEICGKNWRCTKKDCRFNVTQAPFLDPFQGVKLHFCIVLELTYHCP
ncbi:hypothetical protein HZS_2008, partial [Henneguya salminicola]